MQTPTLPERKPRRVGLRVLQFIWLATTVFSLALLAVSTPFRFQELSTFCAEVCASGQLHSSDAAALAQAGLSLPAYALYTIALYTVFNAACWAVAGLLIWRRANDATAVLAALALVAQGVSVGLTDSTLPNGWDYGLTLILLVWFTSLIYLLFLFPDGRFVPRWTRWAFAPWVIWFLLGVVYIFVALDSLPDLFWQVMVGLIFGTFVLGGVAQLYRYRRVSTRVQRQQTKWVVAGFAVYISAELLYVFYTGVLQPALGLPVGGLAQAMGYTALDVAWQLVIPLAIGGAVLRYRLWDIDLVIRRTLLYSTLTALLAAAYFGSVALLQNAAAVVTGERQSALVTVLSTLLIAALFAPVRLAVQRFIDRRFFRRRYDAARALAEFAATIKDDADLEELSAELLDAVKASMEPEHATLWVRKMEKA